MNIRKIAFALGSAFMLFATTLSAQEQPWSFGVKGGVGMSWLPGIGEVKFDGKSDSKATYNWIFAGGLTAGYNFHENVGVGLEVLYSGLGGKTKEEIKTKDDTIKARTIRVTTHNLVIPVMAKFFPMGQDSDAGILNIHLGPQFEMPLLGATVEKSTTNDEKLEEDGKFKKDFLRPFTVSGALGIGYEFPGIGFTLEGRYSYSMMNSMKDTDEAKTYKKDMVLEEDQKLTNRSFVFSVGYNFAKLLMD